VTVLVTFPVPGTADTDDAATLIAVTAQSSALTATHTTGVEGHLPLPEATVNRGRDRRPDPTRTFRNRPNTGHRHASHGDQHAGADDRSGGLQASGEQVSDCLRAGIA
jgi:hypothetical protein